jgi:ABC-type Na+ efflux pump permease subunit
MDLLIFILVISPLIYAITVSIISTEKEKREKQ